MEGAVKEIGRAMWLKDRRTGIGGSDAAAILGRSPWGTPLSVWLEKRGEVADKGQSELMYWGSELEDAIARRYARDTGRKLWKPGGIIRHPDHPELIGTPDRIVIGESRGVEIKMADRFASGDWGETYTDQAPPYYLLQCIHYMSITGFNTWDVAVLVGGNDFRVYTVRRDPELEAAIVARLTEWWKRHIIDGVRPEMDGSGAARDWLSRRFPANVEEKPIPATAEARTVAILLADARAEIAENEEKKALCENEMKALIGDGAGFVGDTWRVSWKNAKGREAVDWKKVAVELGAELDGRGASELVAAAIKRNTSEVPGSRRFLFTEKRREIGE